MPAPRVPIKMAGRASTLVLFNDGTVSGFGLAVRGAIGPLANVNVREYGATSLVNIKLPQKAIDVASGEDKSFAVLEDGSVVGWGTIAPFLVDQDRLPKIVNGQDGFENPVPIPKLSGVVAISGHSESFLALTKSGEVYEWSTELYNKGYKPRKVDGLSNITQIGVMGVRMALDKSGNVYTWGSVSASGSLGRETNPEKPEIVKGVSDVISIAPGGFVSTVVKRDGTVWAWGSNFCCQLGIGTKTEMPVTGSSQNKIQKSPKQVPGIQGAVKVVNSAGNYSVAILRDGTIRTWGRNDLNQLGIANRNWYPNIIGKPAISNVDKVWTVINNTFAVTKDGAVFGWGDKFRSGYPLSQMATTPTRLSFK